MRNRRSLCNAFLRRIGLTPARKRKPVRSPKRRLLLENLEIRTCLNGGGIDLPVLAVQPQIATAASANAGSTRSALETPVGTPYALALGAAVGAAAGNSSQSPSYDYAIDWGDGSHQLATPSSLPSNGMVTHVYATPGVATITANLVDPSNPTTVESTAISRTIVVENVPPTLAISGPASVVNYAAYTLQLSASYTSTTVGNHIHSWAIDWGDRTPAQVVQGSPQSVTHTYCASGTYTIAATATDDNGTFNASTFVGSAGEFDPSFGGSGSGLSQFGGGSALVVATASTQSTLLPVQSGQGLIVTSSAAGGFRGMAVLPDGGSIAVGVQSGGQAQVLRYDSGGTLLGSLSSAGLAEADAVAVQPLTGSYAIVVAGRDAAGNPGVIRYSAGGDVLSSSLGTGKTQPTFAGGNFLPDRIAVQSTGAIVVAGRLDTSGALFSASDTWDLALVRFNAKGQLDKSFGTGGVVVAGVAANGADPCGMAVQPDDSIVLAAGVQTAGNMDFGVMRYSAKGVLDGQFGASGGLVTTYISGSDRATAVAVQSDGCILVGGYGAGMDLVRYLPSGQLDSSFDNCGISRQADGSISAISVQADNKILVAGGARRVDNYFQLARFTVDGQLDTTFGNGGTVGDALIVGGRASAMAVQPDGRIVLAGQLSSGATYEAVLARYDPGEIGDVCMVVPAAQGVQAMQSGPNSQGAQPALGTQGAQGVISSTSASSSTISNQAQAQTQQSPCQALLNAVRQALGIDPSAQNQTINWALLTSLTADSNHVTSLEGLENATNLQSLTLVPGNFAVPGQLTDLSPLAGLGLKSLTLQDCGLDQSLVAALPSLPNLQTLDLRYNNFTAAPSIGNVPKLSSLLLYGNPLGSAWYSQLAGKLLTVDIAPNNPASVITQELAQYESNSITPQNVYTAVAAAFYDLPIGIYQYLVNKIQYQPYQGAMKGPLAVLQTGAGNDWDTDSLLMQLFTAAGISTTSMQYAFGRVLLDIPTTMKWLAVKTPAAAYDALALAGLNPVLENQTCSSALNPATQLASAVYLAFDHAWLQATVTPPGGVAETVNLDPTWKFKDLQPGLPGMLTEVPFATDDSAGSYLSSSVDQTAAEFYQGTVRTWLAGNAPDMTIADVPYDGPIHLQTISAFPTYLPFYGVAIVSSTGVVAYHGTQYSVTVNGAIPDSAGQSLIDKVRISVAVPQSGTVSGTITSTDPNTKIQTITLTASTGSPFAQWMQDQSAPIVVPIVVNNVTVGNAALTVTTFCSSSQVIVQGISGYTSNFTSAYSVSGFSSLQNVPNISLQRITIGYPSGSPLTPHLYINGTDTATSALTAASGSSVDLVVQTIPGANAGDYIFPETRIFPRPAGNYLAIGLDAAQISDSLLVSARKTVNDANIDQADDSTWASQSQANQDQLTGGLLNLAMVDFFLNCDQSDQSIAGLTAAMPVYNLIAFGVATANSPVTNSGNSNLQVRFLPSSMLIDVQNGNWNSVSIDEAAVTMTTVPGQERAFTAEDVSHYALMGYNSSAEEALVWEDLTNTPSMCTTKSLKTAYQNGQAGVATIPANSTQAYINSALPGLGQTIRQDIFDYTQQGDSVVVPTAYTDIGSGSTLWQGVGYFVIDARGIDIGNIIDAGDGNPHGGITGGPPDSVITAPPDLDGMTVGEPINPADGDVTHVETDFSIPNLGTPLQMVRSYDSFNTVASGTAWSDRGMGDGWSFSYSDTITTNGGSSLTWFTDSGLLLNFTKTGSIYNTPPTIFGTLAATSGGYLWTDKTGATATFTTIGTVSYITQIKDRYGNGVKIDRNASNGQILFVSDLFAPIVNPNNLGDPANAGARYLAFTYTNNHITQVTDFTGRTWLYGYDSGNRLANVTAPIDSSHPKSWVSYYYDTDATLNDLLKSVLDADNNLTQYAYYANRRGFQETDPQRDTQDFSYNIYGSCTAFTNERGQTTGYTYDANGNVTQQLNPDGTTLAYTWANGLRMSDTDEYGQTESYVYSTDGLGNVTQFTNRLGEVTTYTYTDYSNPFTVTRQAGGSQPLDGAVTQYFYYTVSGQQNATKHQNGADFCLWKVVDGLGNVTSYTYPSPDRGEPQSVTAPNGNLSGVGSTTWYAYNDPSNPGLVTATYLPVLTSNATQPNSTTYVSLGYVMESSAYTAGLGTLTSSTDGNGNTTTYTYDSLGQMLTETQPVPDPTDVHPLPAPLTQYSYDANGNLISTTLASASGAPTTWAVYDTLGRAVKTVNPDGTYTTSQYDPAGNLVATTDAMGRATQYIYDSRNRQIAAIQPDGSIVRTEYDGGGRVVGQADALGNTTQYAYDKLGRKTVVTQPNPAGCPAATAYSGYDPAGDLAYVAQPPSITVTNFSFETPHAASGYATNPTGATWAFGAPAAAGIATNGSTLNNPNAPDGTQVAFLQPMGSFSQSINFPNAGTYTIGFQAAYRANHAGADPFQVQVDTQIVGTFNPTTGFFQSYLTSFVVSSGYHTVSFVGLDASGVDQTSFIDAVWISAGSAVSATSTTLTTYDDANDKIYVTNALGTGYSDANHTTETDYDKLGRVVKVIQPIPDGTQTSGPTTSTTYDANGNVQTVTDPRGHVTTYFYDQDNRKIVQEESDPGGSPSPGTLFTWYYYDNNGNLQYVVDAAGATSSARPYPYSSSASYAAYTTQYVYDNLNRKSKEIDPAATVYQDGQTTALTVSPTTSYCYDSAGNLYSVTDPNNNTTTYTYDLLDRRITTKAPPVTIYSDGQNTPTNNYVATTTCAYDAVGNVVWTSDALGRMTTFQYDTMDRKIAEISPAPSPQSPAPSATTWQYDANGNVTSVTDPLGNTTSTQYNACNLPVAVTDALGAFLGDPQHTTTTTYDLLGRVSTVTDPLQRTTLYLYDNLGRKIETIAPDPISGTASQTDGNCPKTYYGYDANGNLKYMTDPRGSTPGDATYTTWYFYDGLNRPDCTINAFGLHSTWSVSNIPDAAPAYFPGDCSSRTAYDALGNVIATTDEMGRTTNYQYDNLGRKTAQIAPPGVSQVLTSDSPALQAPSDWGIDVGDGYGGYSYPSCDTSAQASWTFSPGTNLAVTAGTPYQVFVTWAGVVFGGNTQSAPYSIYDGTATSGTLLKTVIVNQKVSPPADPEFTDSSSGWLSLGYYTFTGSTVTVTLSGVNGQVNADAVRIVTSSTTSYTYDANGNLLSTTDPDAHTTWTVYDALNRVVTSVSADGSGPSDPTYATTTGYDEVGNVSRMTDPDANTTSWSYDRLGRKTAQSEVVALSVGSTTTATEAYQYDSDGNVVQVTDADGRVTQFVFDPLNRQVEEDWRASVGAAITHTIDTYYDADGETVGVTETDTSNPTNPTNYLTNYQYSYDADGNVHSSRMAPGGLAQTASTTLYLGTLSGSLSGNWQGNGQWVNVTLAATLTNQSGSQFFTLTSGAFDPTLIVLPSSAVTTIVVNGVTIPTSVNWSEEIAATDSGGAGTAYLLQNVALGSTWCVFVTSKVQALGNYALTWTDNAHPFVPTAVTELDYTYDAAGNVLTVIDSSNVSSLHSITATTTYVYDALSRVTSISQAGSGVSSKQVQFGYYNDSQVQTVTSYAGASQVAVGAYGYYVDGQLASLSYTHNGIAIKAGNNPISYGLTYDLASNVNQVTSADGTNNYTLDSANQLTSANQTGESYTYDQNGNRTSTGYQTAAGNRLLSDGTGTSSSTYQYDAEGNRTQRIRWNCAATDYLTLYAYDQHDRLCDVIFENFLGTKTGEIQYTYDYAGRLIRTATDATGSGTFAYTYTVYDGQNPYLQVSGATPSISQRYLYGPAVDQILATDNCAGTVLWGLADYEGTIRDVVDNSGTPVTGGHIQFDSFGKPINSTAPVAGFLFGLNGMRYDPTTKQYQTQTVAYDPWTGQRLSQDPLGFASGTTNFTAWCGNSPVGNVDPSGECDLSSAGYSAGTALSSAWNSVSSFGTSAWNATSSLGSSIWNAIGSAASPAPSNWSQSSGPRLDTPGGMTYLNPVSPYDGLTLSGSSGPVAMLTDAARQEALAGNFGAQQPVPSGPESPMWEATKAFIGPGLGQVALNIAAGAQNMASDFDNIGIAAYNGILAPVGNGIACFIPAFNNMPPLPQVGYYTHVDYQSRLAYESNGAHQANMMAVNSGWQIALMMLPGFMEDMTDTCLGEGVTQDGAMAPSEPVLPEAVVPENLPRSGLQPLVSDMPELNWYGTRILGTAQETQTPGHVLQIVKQVQKMAQSSEYEYITLNRSWKVTTGLDGAAGDLRPDIIGVRRNGVVDAFEVMSKSDKSETLLSRLNEGMGTLPVQNRGAVRVIPYPYGG